MKIIVDTREQRELTFDAFNNIGNVKVEVKKDTLKVGDYCAEFSDGHRPNLVFERKSVGDLYGTFGKGYPRFKKRIVYAQDKGINLIIIVEAPLSKVIRGYKHSSLEGISIVYKLFTLWVKYGVKFICCKDRSEASLYIVHTYVAMGKEYLRKLGKRRLN